MSHAIAWSSAWRARIPSWSQRLAVGLATVWLACLMPGTALASHFSVTPQALAFGSVPVGATKTIDVTIRNTSAVSRTPNFSGGAPLDATNFGGSQNCAGKTFAPGATCTFTYEFTPQSTGTKSSSTTIGIDNENFAITMSGTGVPAFSVAPTSLSFGNVAVGATKAIAVVITNTSGVSQSPNFSGGAPLDAMNFGGSQNCAGKTFAPGASCVFTYEFKPQSLGTKSSSTTIGIDSQNFAITMTGTGVGAFTMAPLNLNFGSVAVGATKSIAVTVTNTSGVSRTPNFSGGAPLDAVNFGGSQNCAGKTFAPGATCTFTYEFTPQSVGAKTSSTSVGIDNQQFTITMTGSGVEAAAFRVSPLSLSFGNVAVGESKDIVVTVTNTSGMSQTPNFSGGAPIDSINFDASQNCAGKTFAPGATCRFTYTFQPVAPGEKATTTIIGIDNADFPLALSGTGVSKAVEYYHAAFDHYFVTTLADEIAMLDGGTFAGWARTGQAFNVFGEPGAGRSTVCRFFSAAFAPKSSHFYTPFPDECAIVKANPDWQFEGEVFHVALPSLGGSCPPGTQPVYRLYNDGKGGAPNHRFTKDLDVATAMIAQGWVPEGFGIGVGMCAPA